MQLTDSGTYCLGYVLGDGRNGMEIRDQTLNLAKHCTGRLSVAKITPNLSASYNFG